MKYIAEGFEFRVYLMEDGRVLKKEISYPIRLLKIFKITRSRGFSLLKSLTTAINSDKKNRDSFMIIQEKMELVPKDLFANPEFTGKGRNFTQDKVVVIEDYLEKYSLEDCKSIIDKYINFQETLWSYGIHDAVYKFQPNYGVSNSGDVVCIDFGEFVFTKQGALKSVEKKKWLNRSSYKKWEECELKRYYTQKMEESMTPRNLDDKWGILLP